jgi:hypothetical protein
LISDVRIIDFGAAWNDGYLLCRLVGEVGGNVSTFNEMVFDDKSHWLWNVRQGFFSVGVFGCKFGVIALDAAIDIGVNVNLLLSAEEIVELNSDPHLGLVSFLYIEVLIDIKASRYNHKHKFRWLYVLHSVR